MPEQAERDLMPLANVLPRPPSAHLKMQNIRREEHPTGNCKCWSRSAHPHTVGVLRMQRMNEMASAYSTWPGHLFHEHPVDRSMNIQSRTPEYPVIRIKSRDSPLSRRAAC